MCEVLQVSLFLLFVGVTWKRPLNYLTVLSSWQKLRLKWLICFPCLMLPLPNLALHSILEYSCHQWCDCVMALSWTDTAVCSIRYLRPSTMLCIGNIWVTSHCLQLCAMFWIVNYIWTVKYTVAVLGSESS